MSIGQINTCLFTITFFLDWIINAENVMLIIYQIVIIILVIITLWQILACRALYYAVVLTLLNVLHN